MHGVIKQLIAAMQQGKDGEFLIHDGSRVAFSSISSIGGEDNVIDFKNDQGESQQTQLGLLVGIEVSGK